MHDPQLPDWSVVFPDEDDHQLTELTRNIAEADSALDRLSGWPSEVWNILVGARAAQWGLPRSIGAQAEKGALLLGRYSPVAEGSLTGAFILSQHDAAIRRLTVAEYPDRAEPWLESIQRGRTFATVGLS